MTDYITGKEFSDVEIHQYIADQNIVQYITEGCEILAKERPAKPLYWLGTWFLEHNKKKPVTEEPTIEEPDKQ